MSDRCQTGLRKRPKTTARNRINFSLKLSEVEENFCRIENLEKSLSRTHNPKVRGSNPLPATNFQIQNHRFLITTLLALTASTAFAAGDMEHVTVSCRSVESSADAGSVFTNSFFVKLASMGSNHGMKLSYFGNNENVNVNLVVDTMLSRTAHH